MTKNEFEQRYAMRSQLTVEQLHAAHLFAIPCECGDNYCEGWQLDWKGRAEWLLTLEALGGPDDATERA